MIFSDKTKFYGGTSYFETKWKEIPDKPISQIFYRLPSGKYICLSDFSRIYHYIEALNDLMGRKKGIVQIESANLIIEKQGKCLHYKIYTYAGSNKYTVKEVSASFILKLNPKYWKKGV